MTAADERRPRSSGERGMTLLMTIAMLTLATTLFAALVSLVLVEARTSRLWEDAHQAERLAHLGAERALYELRRDPLWYEPAGRNAPPGGATSALGGDARATAALCLNPRSVGGCRSNDLALGLPHPNGERHGTYGIELRRVAASDLSLPMCRRETCLAIRVRAQVREAVRYVEVVAAKIAPYGTLHTAAPLVGGAVVRGSLIVPACEGSPCDAVRFTRAHTELGFAGVDVPANFDWGAGARQLVTPSYLRGRIEADVPTRFQGLARVHAYGYGDRLSSDRGGVLGPAARASTDVPRVPSPVTPNVFLPFLQRAAAARVNADVAYVCSPVPTVSCNQAAHWTRRDLADATQVVPFVRDTKVIVLGKDVLDGALRCDDSDGRARNCNTLAGGATATAAAGAPGVPSRAVPLTWSGPDRLLRTDVDGQAASSVVFAWRARVVFDGATAAGPARYLGRALLVVDNPQPRAPGEPAAVNVDSSIVTGLAGAPAGALVVATPGGVHIGAHNRDARHTLPFVETVLGILSGGGINVRAPDARPASLTGPHFTSRFTLSDGSPAPLITHSIFVNGRFLPNLFLGYDEDQYVDGAHYPGVPALAELLAGLDGVRVLSWRQAD